jgi:hypothetical protein
VNQNSKKGTPTEFGNIPFIFPHLTEISSTFISLSFLTEIAMLSVGYVYLCMSPYFRLLNYLADVHEFCYAVFNEAVIRSNNTADPRTCEVGTVLATVSTVQK